jgi:hypothetical protein
MADDIDEFTLSSSNISGGSYNPETRELTLTFASGGEYTYSGVPADTVEALKNAASAGRFWNAIKASFSYTRG